MTIVLTNKDGSTHAVGIHDSSPPPSYTFQSRTFDLSTTTTHAVMWELQRGKEWYPQPSPVYHERA
jgi:hypothetical protein